MHSYIIVGDNQEGIDTKVSQLVPFNNFLTSPDFLNLQTEGSLGIEVIRDLKKFLSRKPYQEDTKVVCLPTADRLTIPAQHALLKTLEEPPGECLIILITSNEALLLPTIISRCQVIRLGKGDYRSVDNVGGDIVELIELIGKQNIGDRVTLAGKYTYPRQKAEKLCLDLINYFRHELISNSNVLAVEDLKLAKTAYERIKANVDPRLTIEHLFLNLR